MSTQKYLCIYRSSPAPSERPSPAQMQEMFAAFNAWKEKFKDNILDIGDRLRPTGKVLTASGVADGPFAESKEIIAGFMILSAESYDAAVAVMKDFPGMQMKDGCVEIREMAGL
jgi:hypothetical protein